MRRRRHPMLLHTLRAAAILAWFAIASASHPALASAGKAKKATSPSRNPYTSSQVCQQCHAYLYDQWVNSLHGSSLTDPVYQGVFKKVGPKDQPFCLQCHAPTVRVTHDAAFNLAITLEGVTCDFCHTVKTVKAGKPPELLLDPGRTKRGPYELVGTMGHKKAYSELHTKAEFCGGCHEVINPNGFAVMDTYEEWKAGPYPGLGTQCQSCHMAQEFGAPAVTMGDFQSKMKVTAHRFLGGHSLINITRAATLSLLLSPSEHGVSAAVYITNAESGHRLPTGIPARKVILELRVLDSAGELLDTRTVEYRRILRDAEGNEIPNDRIEDMFLKAASVKSDNRIAPKETRREEFDIPIPEGAKDSVTIEATLYYLFQVPFLYPNEMKMEMARDVQTYEIPAPDPQAGDAK